MQTEMLATGNCYQDAGRAVSFGPRSSWTLVHGRPRLRRPPYVRYGHAWLENPAGDTCWDPVTDIEMPRRLYYDLGEIRPEQTFRYGRVDAFRWITQTRHWGPWQGPEACPPLEEEE